MKTHIKIKENTCIYIGVWKQKVCAENKKEITTQHTPYICPEKPELKLFSPVSEKIL